MGRDVDILFMDELCGLLELVRGRIQINLRQGGKWKKYWWKTRIENSRSLRPKLPALKILDAVSPVRIFVERAILAYPPCSNVWSKTRRIVNMHFLSDIHIFANALSKSI